MVFAVPIGYAKPLFFLIPHAAQGKSLMVNVLIKMVLSTIGNVSAILPHILIPHQIALTP